MITVEDFSKANALRVPYGLDPMRKPRVLAVGAKEWPIGEGPAEPNDQKDLTDDEYAEYTRYILRSY